MSDIFVAWEASNERKVAPLPTAVNLERTCSTMIAAIPRARMCMKSVAASKMMVLASSTLRA